MPRAHDVPGQVLARILIKPAGNRLQVLVRVPLVAIQDVDFPQHGPAYLTIPDAGPALRQGVDGQIAPGITVYERDARLVGREVVAVMASLPSDRSFDNFDRALAHVLGPRLPSSTDIVWQQAMLDVLFEYPIQSEQSSFSLDPALARLGQRTQTLVTFVRPDGITRDFDLLGNPGLIRLDPTWSQVAQRFVGLGFWHIFDGVEHLLFLACLVIPVRRIRPLVAIITSFAIAHTVTLIAAAFGLAPTALWFPLLIDTLIAASIGWLAFQNALGTTPRRRWMVAFGFGLIHGFAYAFALGGTLQFAGNHWVVSVLAFNVGIEIGQLVMVAGLAALAWALFTFVIPVRAGTIALSGLVAHTAWHWILSRGGQLRLYNITLSWPTIGSVEGIRWAMLVLVVVTLVWLMSRVFPRMERSEREDGYA